jgi:zinc/manganese transport system substrate-binding protein
MLKQLFRLALITAFGTAAFPASAAVNVFACEPEWGALVTELAGDNAKVYVATNAMQDVHHIQARPSLIAAVRRADLVVCTGAELEVGWLPVLLRESGNNRIQRDRPGNFEASRYVRMIEVPSRLDRAEGDIHPMGNPHIHTDPRNIARVAEALGQRLGEIDPAHAATYRSRLEDFSARWDKAMARWQTRAMPLRGVPVVEYHKAFSYLFAWVGIQATGFLEPKPGVDPSTGHLTELLAAQKAHPAKMVVRASYNDPRAADWFAQRARIPVVVLPFTVGGDAASKDLFSWFDDMIDRLLKGAK